jgi:hypothetical protein
VDSDPQHFDTGTLDPHPQQNKNPDTHQFAVDKRKRNISLIEHFFNGLSLYLEARIWIRIRIK